MLCSKIAEAEAAVSVNEKKWLVMHMHVQLQLDDLYACGTAATARNALYTPARQRAGTNLHWQVVRPRAVLHHLVGGLYADICGHLVLQISREQDTSRPCAKRTDTATATVSP